MTMHTHIDFYLSVLGVCKDTRQATIVLTGADGALTVVVSG